MADQNGKKFIEGMRFSEPRSRAPVWIKGHISVSVAKFLDFAQANMDERGWLNIDMKESKGGKIYLELDTWKPGARKYHETIEKAEEERPPDELPAGTEF